MRPIIKIIDEERKKERDKKDILSCIERAHKAIERKSLSEWFGLYVTAENLYRVMGRQTGVELTLKLSKLNRRFYDLKNERSN